MEQMRILTYPDSFLLKPTAELENIDGRTQQMIDSMAETMYAAPGIGLASIQIGWDRSVLIYDISARNDQRQLHVLINPRIVASEGEVFRTTGPTSSVTNGFWWRVSTGRASP